MKKLCLLFTAMVCLFCTQAYANYYLKTGTYELLGSNSESRVVNYQGEVIITRRGSNYELLWLIGRQQVQVGVGILYGDVLSVAFQGNSYADIGVASFRLISHNEMEGTWARIGSGGQGCEYLSWIGP